MVGFDREPARAPLVSFDDPEGAARGPREASRWFLPLEGAWAFRLFDAPHEVPDLATEPRYDDAGWDRIQVPGCWTRQGFDHPHYTNVQMPFAERPPHVPRHNPTGVYRRRFDLPASWRSRRVVLHLGGAESLVYVLVNGRPVGLSKDSRLPAEFDITSSLVSGANLIVAIVVRWCDGTFLEDQDHWFHAGLHREVFLRATPKTRIDDLRVVADYDPEAELATLEVEARIAPACDPADGLRVRAELLLPNGRPALRTPLEAEVATRSGHFADPYLYAGAVAALRADVPRARPWTAETPELHTLVTSLLDADGRVLECVSQRVGFRRVEVVGRELRVNGQAIRVRGVNRHDHHPVTGKTLRLDEMRAELVAMKRHHVNAIRTAHYPNDPRLLDLCDELGLYVVDEANVEAHAYWAELCRDPRYTAAFVERGTRMVLRDRNHPAVILWSLGNESGYGPNHGAMAGWIRRTDPTRPIQYEGGHAFDLAAEVPETDIVCPMYTPVDALVRFARSAAATRPIVLCEYSHAMGNSNGGLDAYVDAFETVKGLQGGFVWDWKDQGLLERDPATGEDRYVYGGAFGDEPHDGTFCLNGLVAPDGTAHPALHELAHLFEPLVVRALDLAKGRFRLQNRRHFRDLTDLRGSFEVRVDGRVVERGVLPALEVEPGTHLDFRLRWKKPEVAAGEGAWLDLHFAARHDTPWAAKGEERAWAQFPLPRRLTRALPKRRPSTRAAAALEIREQDDRLEFTGEAFTFGFDRVGGGLDRLEVRDADCLRAASRLQLFRAPTCNDATRPVPAMPKPLDRWLGWKLDSLRAACVSFGPVRRRGGRDGFEIVHETPLGLVHTERWSLDPQGASVEHRFEVPEDLDDLPRLGIALGVVRDLDHLTWVGRGPHECYADRSRGARLGRYSLRVSEAVLPYVVPQEYGLRTGTTWLALQRDDGRGFRVRAPSGVSFSACTHSPDQLYEARRTGHLPARRGVWLSLDRFHRGVGTGACGPETAPAFRVPSGTHRLRLRFEPLRRPL